MVAYDDSCLLATVARVGSSFAVCLAGREQSVLTQ